MKHFMTKIQQSLNIKIYYLTIKTFNNAWICELLDKPNKFIIGKSHDSSLLL